MKREEIKALLNVEGLTDEQKKSIIDSIMDINGKDINDAKEKVKALEEKVKGHDELQAKYEELSKTVDTMKGFEEKAKKFDEINPKYEEALKTAKDNELTTKVKSYGFDDKFVKFIKSEIGEKEGDELDSALKDYATKNPQYLVQTNPMDSNPSFEHKNKGTESVSMRDAVAAAYEKK